MKPCIYHSKPTLKWDDGSGSFPTHMVCFRLWQPLFLRLERWRRAHQRFPHGLELESFCFYELYIKQIQTTPGSLKSQRGVGWLCTSLCLDVFSVRTDVAAVDHQKVHRKWHKIKALSAPRSYLFNRIQVDALEYKSLVGSSLTNKGWMNEKDALMGPVFYGYIALDLLLDLMAK